MLSNLIPQLNYPDIALGLVAGWLILKQPDFAAKIRDLVIQAVLSLIASKPSDPPAGK